MPLGEKTIILWQNPEYRKHMCEVAKGRIPWIKGKHHTQEAKEKVRQGNLGKKLSPETRKKMSIARRGKVGWARGKPWTEARKLAQLKGKKKKSFGKIIVWDKEYCIDWHKIRIEVYRRDNWTCQECGKKCHHSIKIQCHHIDYDISNNDFSNLITLCSSCHGKTNFKRKDWTNYFDIKLQSNLLLQRILK